MARALQLDQEMVRQRSGVVAAHVRVNPGDGGLHLRRARNPQRNGAGLGLVGQALAHHLHGNRKADLRRGLRRFTRAHDAARRHRHARVSPAPVTAHVTTTS